MGSYSRIHRAETTGRRVGGVVRLLRFRGGRSVLGGGSSIIARVLLWAVGLAILGALVLVAFWLAVVVAFVWGAIKLLPHISESRGEIEPEWRQGVLGFGLYDANEFRIDPHDTTRNEPH